MTVEYSKKSQLKSKVKSDTMSTRANISISERDSNRKIESQIFDMDFEKFISNKVGLKLFAVSDH
jgi:transcriptional regulator